MYDVEDFENEFYSDEEVEETLDALIQSLNEQVQGTQNTVSVVNPQRLQCLKYTYQMLKYLTRGTDAVVTYEVHKPLTSMGSVSVVGKNLRFSNSRLFSASVQLASNFEMYPKTDGTVRMDFTFHGITTKVNSEEE